ncbi:hypothetical protein J008_04755 [Cryptococcus neoformans]|nr:hypothetical protein J008_04755 [Cryptococcus neoformans var. grubii]
MDRNSPRKGPRRSDGENRGSFLKSEPVARCKPRLDPSRLKKGLHTFL